MWQRIQTLYLGIATALMFSMFFCTFATIAGPDGAEITIRYSEKLSYLSLMIMTFIAHVAAVASFKAFFLQARPACTGIPDMAGHRHIHQQGRDVILHHRTLPSCRRIPRHHLRQEIHGGRDDRTGGEKRQESQKEQIGFYARAKERSPLQQSFPSTVRTASQKNIGPLLLLSFAVTSQRSPGLTVCLKRTLSIPV